VVGLSSSQKRRLREKKKQAGGYGNLDAPEADPNAPAAK